MRLKSLTDDNARAIQMKRSHEEFLAGGGSEEEYKRIKRLANRIFKTVRKQYEQKTYYGFMAANFFAIKARKPK
jgi:UDP-N-acetylmuramyl tripeptide synthase